MSARVRASRRGFSLIELMVVVIIIGIVAALAIPTFAVTGYDRHAYQDAGAIMMLFRSARTRAVRRGGAVLLTLSANGATDRGTFYMYDAVAANVPGGTAWTPVSTCKSPTTWMPVPLPTPTSPIRPATTTVNGVNFVDGVNLNLAGIETQADIETQLNIYLSPTSATPTQFTLGYVCITPLGHTYVTYGTQATPVFDGALPTVSPIEAVVTRAGGATQRSVLLPPNGMARIFSHP